MRYEIRLAIAKSAPYRHYVSLEYNSQMYLCLILELEILKNDLGIRYVVKS